MATLEDVRPTSCRPLGCSHIDPSKEGSTCNIISLLSENNSTVRMLAVRMLVFRDFSERRTSKSGLIVLKMINSTACEILPLGWPFAVIIGAVLMRHFL